MWIGKKDEPIMFSLDNMHHIAPYPKSQFIQLSVIKKRFHIPSYQCFYYLSCYNRLRTIFVTYLSFSHVWLAAWHRSPEVSRMVAAGKKKISPLTFSLIYGIIQLASMHSHLLFFIAMIFFFCCRWFSLFVLLCKLNQEFSAAYFRSLEHQKQNKKTP